MNYFIFIFLIAVLGAGCADGGIARERKEELCRLLFDPGKNMLYCDSVVTLARTLPAGARLEVLLEAVRNNHANTNNPGMTADWLAEAGRIAPAERRVEVEIERRVCEYKERKSSVSRDSCDRLRLEFCSLEQDYSLTSRQRVLFLLNKVSLNRESNLLDSWLSMKEAQALARKVGDRTLEVRVLEDFSLVVQLAGDYESSLALWKESWRLGEEERLPVNKWSYLTGLAARLSELQRWPEVLECCKELLAEARKASDEGYEKTAMIQIAKIYGTMDSLPEALGMWRRLEMMDRSPYNRIRVWGRMTELFERLGERDSVRHYAAKVVEACEQLNPDKVRGGDIPAYTAYAGILWEEGKRGEAMRLLQKATVVVPHYSRADDQSGGIYLEPYLKALLQLGGYYRGEGRFRQAADLLLLRDSLLVRYNESDLWYKKQKIADRFRNRELQAQVKLQEVLLADRRRMLAAVSVVSLCLAGGLLMVWRLYRAKQRRLDEVYRKQKEVERLERQVAESMTDDPEAVLFRRLEKLVMEQRLFRNPDLSLDDLCPLVGSNRSYVSACVNKEAGMNFSAWISKIRVDDVLASINEECYLPDLYTAAGFASQTSFYRNFKLVTQMTPKQYMEREKRSGQKFSG